MKHVMIDLETLGTVADAVIMSIGAVKFDLDSVKIDDNGFYASVSVDSNLEHNRRVQEGTLVWWMGQGAEAQGVFHEPKQTLDTALDNLSDWIGGDSVVMWSNGADFDLPMLAHAYTSLRKELPWEYWNSRCFRTFKNLPGAKGVKAPFTGVKHNALSDAIHQAQTAQAIQAKLFSGNHVFKVKDKA